MIRLIPIMRKNWKNTKTISRSPSESRRKNWTGKSPNDDGKRKRTKTRPNKRKNTRRQRKILKTSTGIATAGEAFVLSRRLSQLFRRVARAFALFRFPSWLGKFSDPLYVAIRVTTELTLSCVSCFSACREREYMTIRLIPMLIRLTPMLTRLTPMTNIKLLLEHERNYHS